MEAKQLLVQKTVFDMGEFDNVLVGKRVTFTPVDSMEAALASVGNDEAKLVKIVNAGLEKEVRDQAYSSSTDWHNFKEEGTPSLDTLNGPFEGTIADPADVNETVRTLSKTVFGYVPGRFKEGDAQLKVNENAKELAKQMVKNTPGIREGLMRKASGSK